MRVLFILICFIAISSCGAKLRQGFPSTPPEAFETANIAAEINIGAARFDFETDETNIENTRFTSSKITTNYSQNRITYPQVRQSFSNPLATSDAPDPNFEKARAPRKDVTLDEILSQYSGKPITIFVHGYNNSFETALNLVSDFAMNVRASKDPDTFRHPMRNDIILLSWPESELNNILDIIPFIASIRQYSNAQETVLTVRTNVKNSLYDIANKHNGEVNLVAHSMGSVLLLETLRDMAKENRTDIGNRFRSLYLYNADIPVSALSSYLNDIGLRNLPRDRRIVASRDDEVLALSENLSGNERVGKITGNPDAMKYFGCKFQFAFYESYANRFDALGHAPKLGTRHRELSPGETAACQKDIETALLSKLTYVERDETMNEIADDIEIILPTENSDMFSGAPAPPMIDIPTDLPPETGQIDAPIVEAPMETPVETPMRNEIVFEKQDSPFFDAAEILLEQKSQGLPACDPIQIETGKTDECVILAEEGALRE